MSEKTYVFDKLAADVNFENIPGELSETEFKQTVRRGAFERRRLTLLPVPDAECVESLEGDYELYKLCHWHQNEFHPHGWVLRDRNRKVYHVFQ